MSKAGGGKRWVLLAPTMYPRTTNKILRAYLKSKWPTRTFIERNTRPGHRTTRPSWLT
jgi:hypothetical protein